MKQTRVVEFGTGMFVLLGFASLFFLILKTTDVQSDLRGETYQVLARFENVGDLKLRAPVTMAGVTIGRVTGITFDSERLDAQVTMRISANFDRIPDDTDASILTAGLIGGQYIGLTPGFSETYLADNSEIQITQSALVLENLIGKFLVKLGGE
ncbi:MAG: outer membrane lipid asymmetry maintenance protein MlaD [Chromatiales bacterium]|nr:outer membrane lipid asymmetry maintenance protein MlaD [Chromatiales bacterium]MDH3931097.1 outer membrane lipid asymmetry maintenance protein MlaD [Chromatiales bacterium]MDH4013152.1 outer membrane lipid asymmetry maintenance protein MlaD [Chromatiales bacterium]PLX57057.1 MAG: outer membrane lipid asymmetry maintenance protein MlaD [Chromatiales bacterium]